MPEDKQKLQKSQEDTLIKIRTGTLIFIKHDRGSWNSTKKDLEHVGPLRATRGRKSRIGKCFVFMCCWELSLVKLPLSSWWQVWQKAGVSLVSLLFWEKSGLPGLQMTPPVGLYCLEAVPAREWQQESYCGRWEKWGQCRGLEGPKALSGSRDGLGQMRFRYRFCGHCRENNLERVPGTIYNIYYFIFPMGKSFLTWLSPAHLKWAFVACFTGVRVITNHDWSEIIEKWDHSSQNSGRGS